MTTTMTTPRIYLECASCHRNGEHIGTWVEARDARDIDAETIHDTAHIPATQACAEVLVTGTDADHVFPRVCSIDDAETVGIAFEKLDHDSFNAWCAYGRLLDQTPSLHDFEAAFYGQWASFDEFAHDHLTNTVNDVPESISHYVNWEAWARDLRYDFEVVDGPHDDVYIFRH